MTAYAIAVKAMLAEKMAGVVTVERAKAVKPKVGGEDLVVALKASLQAAKKGDSGVIKQVDEAAKKRLLEGCWKWFIRKGALVYVPATAKRKAHYKLSDTKKLLHRTRAERKALALGGK